MGKLQGQGLVNKCENREGLSRLRVPDKDLN